MLLLNQIPKTIIYVSVLISLCITPWINVDSQVIPKVIILFCLASYLLPKINFLYFLKHKNIYLNSIFLISVLIVIQMLLVIIFTNAPIDQQIFGRSGRGLGLITYISLIIVLLAVTVFMTYDNSNLIIYGICISSTVSSLYSILQYFGLDLIDWASKTNGIIGTLGNPNFQSAFAAMSLPFAIVFLRKNNVKFRMLAVAFALLTTFTIYICESYQGYIAALLSLSIIFSLYLWKLKRVYLYMALTTVSIGIFGLISGIFNSGPFSGFIFKSSVASRREMWRTSLSTSSDNPVFGIGIDSFGDYSNYYQSASDAMGINEYIDNSHNYFLEYAATGGYPLAILHIFLILLTVFSFIKIQYNLEKFDINLSTLFGAWVAFQSQSLISPANISLMLWNFIITGFIVGSAAKINSHPAVDMSSIKTKNLNSGFFSILLLIAAIVISYPYFNADMLQKKSAASGDVLLAVKVAKMHPESIIRYQKIGVELLQAGFVEQSVDIARAAVKFSPNSFYGWALLLSSNSTLEKNKAVKELKRLNPHNKLVMELDYFE
jgi:O-antigen ligase